ncbi:hypothetical protein ACFFX1_45890 [Dactylosporangium sucinum]|uniref:Uncharacterized protein n=1 Tax=Dactylosporangium sucinum TaxID=1424081 RepID=A0A917WUM4_9ACTN|nr:hypothetical protein [Dactylosporangium sucinum]GGM31472.1 hypothetical protein GCM10007977_035900 [Dactylosporangium sucinum]
MASLVFLIPLWVLGAVMLGFGIAGAQDNSDLWSSIVAGTALWVVVTAALVWCVVTIRRGRS